MSGSTWQKKVAALGILGLCVSLTSPVSADMKWYDALTMSGYVQGSYGYNLNSPMSRANVGRAYDIHSNSFGLNSVLLQIAKPVGDDHYGFTTKLRVGKDAEILNALDATGATPAVRNLGSTGNVYVEEAYLIYAVPALTKLSFSAGRFLTPIGFEVADTVYNPNYSEGLLFWFAEPVGHTGIKTNYVFNDMVNATLGVVNGWDVTSDNNDGKSVIWQIATAPLKGLTWSFQGTYGNELARSGVTLAAPNTDHSKRLSLDTVAAYTLGKFTLAGQANWGQDTHTSATDATTHWSGAGVWASFAATSMFTESVRFEVLSDQNNANRFAAAAFPDGTTNQTVKEVTVTHKTMLTSALGTRLEFRHDWSNQPYFTRDDGTAVRNQNTISMDWFVLF